MNRDLEPAWRPWPDWSAVWVGALTALAVSLLIGLIGFALGAHQLTEPRTTTFRTARLIATVFNVGGAFFAFVAAGWVTARIAGLRRAEPAILHGVIAWLLTVPGMLLFAALGATTMFGGWAGGVVAGPAGTALPPMTPEMAEAVRDGAMATAIGLLLGVIGSALGGWLASGEPMRVSYYRHRERALDEAPRRAA
jgi:hypothetical protein